MKALFLIGRIILGGFFLMSGLGHLTHHAAMAPLVAAKGIPVPDLAVIVSGLFIVLGGAGIMLGAWPRVGIGLIIIFLVVVSPIAHNFWAASNPNERTDDLVNFSKRSCLRVSRRDPILQRLVTFGLAGVELASQIKSRQLQGPK